MRIVALGGTLVVLALAGAQSAAASSVETDCANFKSTLAAAGEGDTIVLDGLCSGPSVDFTLPETPALTIEGAPGHEDGFDGSVDLGGDALDSAPGGSPGLTLRNLTFENYKGCGGVLIQAHEPNTHPFAFVGDTFRHNSTEPIGPCGNGGGLAMIITESKECAYPGGAAPVTLANSTFIENTSTGQAGGGAYIDLECKSGSVSASITGNVFEHNQVVSETAPQQGGGLWVGIGHAIIANPFPEVQRDNLFEGNSVVRMGATVSPVAGGGEFTDDGDVTSVGDRFIGNEISGANLATQDSEGGGFASLDPGQCSTAPGATSSAVNLVAAANKIGAPSGTGGGGEGAGVYVGCFPGGHGYHLTLVNSTIAGNTALGGGDAVSGLDGESGDFAVLQNTIVADNAGANLGGFGTADGENVSASFSDVCAIGALGPFAGDGNICASPALAGAAAGDVHETASSPTVDAGSNALIGAQATDAFGGPRIVAGRIGDAATVDIGADELPAPAAVPPAPGAGRIVPTGAPSTHGTARASAIKAIAGGVAVTVRCSGKPGQTCAGAVALKTVETVRGRQVLAVAARHKRHRVSVVVGAGSFTGLKAGTAIALHIKLNRTGRKLLHRFHRLPLRVVVSQRIATGKITVGAANVTVRPPKPRRHRHG